jgi:RNA polymerase sigma factor (sigma-70 family)
MSAMTTVGDALDDGIQAPLHPVENDDVAWADLVNRYGGLLRATAAGFRLSPTEAQDAAQTTWLQLVRYAHGVRDPERLGGWLRITMRRTCLSVIRQRQREVLVDRPMDDVTDGAPAPDARTLRRERDLALWAAVDRLPNQQRQVIRALFVTAEPSYEEISTRLAIPVGSIGPTRGRALDRLRIALDSSGLTIDDLA